jgi:hypothetical protein
MKIPGWEIHRMITISSKARKPGSREAELPKNKKT